MSFSIKKKPQCLCIACFMTSTLLVEKLWLVNRVCLHPPEKRASPVVALTWSSSISSSSTQLHLFQLGRVQSNKHRSTGAPTARHTADKQEKLCVWAGDAGDALPEAIVWDCQNHTNSIQLHLHPRYTSYLSHFHSLRNSLSHRFTP